MNLRQVFGLVLIAAVVSLAGCPKGNQQYNAGSKAESVKDYDTALDEYNKALQSQPNNIEYQLKAARARFEAGQWHVDQGRHLLEQSNLELALMEFRKAAMIDPSSAVAAQEVQATLNLINAKQGTPQSAAPSGSPSGSSPGSSPGPSPASEEPKLMAGPPQITPLSRAPINIKATNDAKAVFDVIGKAAGLTVIFDADFTSRRISVELNNVTLEQALNIVALQSKAFWRPVTSNIIFVIPDQPQKRKDYEEEIVKTFYLKNTVLPQELTEIITSIRQLLDLRRVQQINAQNAIVIRDTPDRVLLAGKIIDDIDKAKPEVVIQVAIMQARTDRMRNVGITPGTSASATFSPSTTATTGTTGTTATTGTTIRSLITDPHVFTNGYSVTLPGASASFLMTDTSTHIIDDPEIRVVDGQTAKLRIGDRVPVATGSFTAGVGATTTAVNALVNTQFQYLDVGVQVDVTPRIHPDHEISMKVSVVVSSVTGTSTIGGIAQPIISQRSIEHDIRLKDGEVNILGGLIERTDTNTVNGWPGFAKIPFFRYFFSGENVDHEENEVLIVLIPHIVRLPTLTAENLRSIASGTDTNPDVELADDVLAPTAPNPQSAPAPAAASQAPVPQAAAPAPASAPAPAPAPQNPTVRFEPATLSLPVGQTATIGVVVQNVQDLYSIPLLLQFNPAVISIEDVRQGGFLSGGTQEVAIVERVDKERGQAIVSATRMPNTPGVSGSGTLVGVVIKGVAPGNSQLSIVQVNAKDSQQRPIQVVTGEAAIRVQ